MELITDWQDLVFQTGYTKSYNFFLCFAFNEQN